MSRRDMGQPQQDMSLLARYSVMRTNTGYTQNITCLVTYLSTDDMPPNDFLTARIIDLQKLYPFLYSTIREAGSNKPYFQLRDAPWALEDILQEVSFDLLPDERANREQVFQTELSRVHDDSFETTPFWQVVRYLPREKDEGVSYLAISIAHEIADGVGALRLALTILCDDISHLLPETPFPVALEDTMDIYPPLTTVATSLFKKHVLPHLPMFVQTSLFKPTPTCWPATQVAGPPTTFPERLSIFTVPTELVDSVKLAAKKQAISTLHPVLQAALMTALYAVLLSQGDLVNPLSVITPRNERSSDLGHSHLTGNYLSLLTFNYMPSQSDDFWALARSIASSMVDPANIAIGRQARGSLYWLPDPAGFQSSDPRKKTSWEAHFLSMAEDRAAPYNSSLTISNLGKVDLPPKAAGLVWGQPANPFASAVMMSVLSHEQNMEIATTWREGCAMTEKGIKHVEEIFNSILCKLHTAPENVKVGDLLA